MTAHFVILSVVNQNLRLQSAFIIVPSHAQIRYNQPKFSKKSKRKSRFGIDRNLFSVLVLALEFHKAVNQRKYRVVLAYADIVARVRGCAALTNDDIARTHEFTAEFFHA